VADDLYGPKPDHVTYKLRDVLIPRKCPKWRSEAKKRQWDAM